MAVTLPDPSTDAIPALLVVQVPPVPVVVNTADVPAHIGVVPEMLPAFGMLLTVILCAAVDVPQLPVTL